MNRNILFFSRSAYSTFFPRLVSSEYNSLHVVMNLREKKAVKELGGYVVGCFEEEYAGLPVAEIPGDFLKSNYYSDRFLYCIDILERVEILGKMISFWEKIICTHDVNYCVHETISIEAEEVLSLMCRRYSVVDLSMLVAPLNGFWYFKPDPYSSSFPQSVLDSCDVTELDITKAEEVVGGVLNKGHRPDYLELVNDVKNTRKTKLSLILDLLRLLKKLIKNNSFDREFTCTRKRRLFYYNYYVSDVRTALDRFVDDISIYFGRYDVVDRPATGFKVVLFPLHYEPESTLLYFAPNYSNQLAVIEAIAKALPMDWILFVKEHPSQPGVLLQYAYSKLRQRMPNVRYISSNLDASKLLQDKIDAVVTVNGSVGWEALIKGIPVFMFGNVFYDKHPAIYNLEDIQELRSLLLDFSNLKRGSMQDAITLMAKIISYSYEGFYYGPYRDEELNIDRFRKSIELKVCQPQ